MAAFSNRWLKRHRAAQEKAHQKPAPVAGADYALAQAQLQKQGQQSTMKLADRHEEIPPVWLVLVTPTYPGLGEADQPFFSNCPVVRDSFTLMGVLEQSVASAMTLELYGSSMGAQAADSNHYSVGHRSKKEAPANSVGS
jgi:hypothetical protein